MGRPSDWWVLDLDRDPTPGDPDAVRRLAKTFSDFAYDVALAERAISGMGSNDVISQWVGDSGDAFRAEFTDFPPDLKKLHTSYDLCAQALEAYAPKLESAQRQADQALADGRTARDDLQRAQGQLSTTSSALTAANKAAQQYQNQPPSVPKPDPTQVAAATRNAAAAQTANSQAQGAVDAAQARLNAAKTLANQAEQSRLSAARQCASDINKASDAGIHNLHWWQKAFNWVADHWGQIITVLKVIAFVLAIVVLIIGGPLAWVLVGISAILTIDALVKAIQGKGSWWDVLFNALGCIPITEGLTSIGALRDAFEAGGLLGTGAHLLGAMKGAVTGMIDTVRAGSSMLADITKGGIGALQDLFTSARDGLQEGEGLDGFIKSLTKCGDPVDVVSGTMVMGAVDVELPGVLPLILERTYISSYRSGRLFGRGWAGTLDQRLELDSAGVVFVAADGQLLSYPVPRPGAGVLPRRGPRWPLTWDGTRGGELRVEQPETGITLAFAPLPDIKTPDGAAVIAPIRSIRNRLADHIDFEYDPRTAMPVSVTHSGGYRLAVESDDARITAVHLASETDAARYADADPATGVPLARFDYDEYGRLTDVLNSSREPLHFEHDDRGRITGWTDRNGTEYEYCYDQCGRVVSTHGTDEILNSTLEFADGSTRVTNSLGQVRTFEYNDHGKITRAVDPLGNATMTVWDELDRMVSMTDAVGHTTAYAYEGDGVDPIQVTRPDGTIVALAYNGRRQLVTMTEPDGGTWHYQFDARGLQTEVRDPGGATFGYEYDERGYASAVIDPLGHRQTIQADDAGLPVAITDPNGAVSRIARDGFGRPVAVTDATGAVTRYEWTTEGRQAAATHADGTRWSWVYDGEGNQIEAMDPDGNLTRTEIGPFDLPAARTTPDGATYAFTYDGEQRLTAVTDPSGNTWRYEFDPAGRLAAETDFTNRHTRYQYDPAGTVSTRTDSTDSHAGSTPDTGDALWRTITYTHDPCRRLTRRETTDTTDDAPVETVSTFTYDIAGRLVGADNADAELAITRDALGRVLTENVNGRILTNTYDAAGNRIGRTTPTGILSSWSYGPTGLPSALTSASHSTSNAIGFSHDEAGRETRRVLGPHAALNQAWDANNRLKHQLITTDEGRREEQRRQYGYSPTGVLQATDDYLAGTLTYEIDAVGRVVARTRAGSAEAVERYTYDGAGNITTSSIGGIAEAGAGEGGHDTDGEHQYTGVLLRRAGRTHYEYDQAGRVVRQLRRTQSGKRLQWRYRWDGEDRLTHVTTPDGATWHYQYDALGRRVTKRCLNQDGTTATTTFTWDGIRLAEQTSEPSDHRDHGKTLTWDYQPNGFEPLTQIEHHATPDPGPDSPTRDEVDRRFYAIVTDLVGVPSELVDAEGRIAWRRRGTLWGADLPASTPDSSAADQQVDCPLRFPGQYRDEETGWHYNHHRYYDPRTGRYSTADPLGLAPAPNPYAYVANPTAAVDPLGLAPCDVDPSWGGRVQYGPLDAQGRPTGMTATVESDMIKGGSPADPDIRPPGFTGGRPIGNQARGHLLGNQLGGSGSLRENLVTLVHNPVNTPIMRGFENQIRAAVEGGQSVLYKVTPIYNGTDAIPQAISLEATGSGGFNLAVSIINKEIP